MFGFMDFLEEGRRRIVYADLDDTLVHHGKDSARVHVNDSSGKRVSSVSTKEYVDHVLPKGHSYDFSEFSDPKIFKRSTSVNKGPIDAFKRETHRKDTKSEILTARPDFTDKGEFGKALKKHGIDFIKTHVRRAGNLGNATAKNKAKVVSDAVRKHGYRDVTVYDDSKENLAAISGLRQRHPNTKFTLKHVKGSTMRPFR